MLKKKLSACDWTFFPFGYACPLCCFHILHWNSFCDNTVVSFGALAEFISLIQIINRRKCEKALEREEVWNVWLKWRGRKTLRAEICDFDCCGLRSRYEKEPSLDLNSAEKLFRVVEKSFSSLIYVFPQCSLQTYNIILSCRLQSRSFKSAHRNIPDPRTN